ncbi:MAG: glycosyltransferase family 2 protein [Candidatus Cloacimonetes bacterium]|nr:glycosyltransferase family 2 protein [Candidatus Cloacimonadota bacterium]MDD4156679.1 glycosyltransferase family 2 protein [Candidatus Cloacimonadota bacterium]
MNNLVLCSVGVMAYNEEKNISHILSALLNQQQNNKHSNIKVQIDEIIVISSGSTDNTNNIVEDFSQKNNKIKLIKEKTRNGKSSAINLFIKNANTNILIVESADTIPDKNCVLNLIQPFYNSEDMSETKIGMTGGHPIPLNYNNDFISYAVKLLWKLHHKMALFSPKLGEMIAFKKVFEKIPEQSAVDEASIEAIIKEKGLDCKYIPKAIVYNKGPETLSDFIKQRKRIAIGHLWLKNNQNYSVSSNNLSLLANLFFFEIINHPKDIIKIIAVAKLEILCRILGIFDYHFKKSNPFIWDTINSAKKLRD